MGSLANLEPYKLWKLEGNSQCVINQAVGEVM